MSHYTFTDQFRSIYDKGLELYANGQREAETFFDKSDKAFLAANGMNAQHLYDYVEDATNYDDPTYERALGIELVRRDYFLNIQKGKASKVIADDDSWPEKSDEIKGIAWLPRILPKARAKLRGELPATTMYSCGGDRLFFTTNDIEPSEFLSLIWRHFDDDQTIIDWVIKRIGSKA